MGKNIVICCDGTYNQFGQYNTNVVRLFQLIVRRDAQQVGFYEPGVGTFAAPVFGLRVGEWLGKTLGAAFGYGVKANMEACYRFLMATYEPGDRVYLFGFSRGAFTARSLASMLAKCGLLYPHHEYLVASVSRQYFQDYSAAEVEAFKATFCRDCAPYFVGVWDTVGALGLLLSLRRFDHNRLSPRVSYAYQALSIDEKRASFKPSLWDRAAAEPDQTIEEQWFAGVHSDVGGGYPDHALAGVTLKWMAERAAQHGVLFDEGALDRIQGDPLGRLHESCKGWWLLLGKRIRAIPDDAVINPAVKTRLDEVPEYNPPNLPCRIARQYT